MPVNGINGSNKIPRILPAGKPLRKPTVSTQIIKSFASVHINGFKIADLYDSFTQRKATIAFPKTKNQLINGDSLLLDAASSNFLSYISLLQDALNNIMKIQTDSMSATTSQHASKIDISQTLQNHMDNLMTLSNQFQEKSLMKPFYQRLSIPSVKIMVYKMYVCDTLIEKFFKKYATSEKTT